MEALVQKITKKQELLNEQNEEKGLAKTMTYDDIVKKIAEAKSTRAEIQKDICGLVAKRDEAETTINKLSRIMRQKKILAGA